MILHRTCWLALLFFLSGFAALVDEVLFSRLLQFSLGVSIHATSAVVAAFLAGMGLGAFCLAPASRATRRPTLIYGVLELALGVMLPVFPFLLHALTPGLASLFSGLAPQSALFSLIRFACAFAILVVPSFLMGGTLPFLIRAAVSEEKGRRSTGVGLFYGINTLGAAAGALVSGYLLLPGLGYGGTVLAASGLSACVGLAAIALGLREDRPPAAPDALPQDKIPPGKQKTPVAESLVKAETGLALKSTRTFMIAALFLGGCISLSYQILWTRVLINFFGGSVYSFALVLSIFLAAMALGSAVLPGLISRMRSALCGLGLLLALSALATACGILFLRAHLHLHGPLGDGYNLYPEAGDSFSSTVIRFSLLTCAATFPATFFLGAMMPTAAGIWASRGDLSRFTGRLYALSSLGSIIGSLLAAFVLLPLLSAEGGILATALASAALAVILLVPAWRRHRRSCLVPGSTALLGLVLIAVAHQWRPPTEPGVETVFFQEGAAATAKAESFQDEGDTILSLRVNGKVVATTGFLDRRLQLLLGYCSTLCHPDPQRILSVGMGTGMSSGALAAHGPERFEIVELSGAVVEAAACFSDYNHDVTRGRARITLADGRNHLLLTRDAYDLIAADPIHPWVAGSGNLYTMEYFSLAASRLEPGGVMCQWVPLYQLSRGDMQSVLATFHAVFPHVRVFYTGYDLVVVGSLEPMPFDAEQWKQRILAPKIAKDLRSIGIRDAADLLASFLFAEEGLEAFLGEAPVLNRDANQTLEYSAPRSLWKPYDTDLILDLLERAESLEALAPMSAWPELLFKTTAQRRASYADAVRAFFHEMAERKPGARRRFREKISSL